MFDRTDLVLTIVKLPILPYSATLGLKTGYRDYFKLLDICLGEH